MPTFKLSDKGVIKTINQKSTLLFKRAAVETFTPSVLGLGDINSISEPRKAIAAFFDLEKFTNFCKQIDPEFSVPIYLSGFLNWFFKAIRDETINSEHDGDLELWHDLPFFTKFIGDGLLVMWDSSKMGSIAQTNLILSCQNMLNDYKKTFLPGMSKEVSEPPPRLRCGISKGNVFSVGNGQDFVGSCINVASRLQKLGSLSIAFTRRGFNPEKEWDEETLVEWILKKVSIRGIGENELVYILKYDYNNLSTEDKEMFSDP